MDSDGQTSQILPGAALDATVLGFLLALLRAVLAAQLAEREGLLGAPVHGLSS